MKQNHHFRSTKKNTNEAHHALSNKSSSKKDSMADFVQRDLAHIWHPCSQMKDYEDLPPIIIDHGKGVYLYDMNGKKYLDIISSWWCNLFGHANPKINAAIKEQLDTLEHVIFANFSHKGAVKLAEELLKVLPKGLNKFHFNDNGSGAVEAALKMSFQYHHQMGKAKKQKFMCLSEGYHGETIGALSVGSMDLFTEIYKPMMMNNIHVEAPDCYRCKEGKTRDTCNVECFYHVEEAFQKHAKETAALIVEPILQGSAGMRIYPAKYLKKLRQITTHYGVHLICDEIATGFGRTGKMFASQHADITPDIMCISKGLTGGYMPMSITITTDEIYNAFYADYQEGRAFMHSHTYSGNPLGAAAGLAVLKIFEEEDILEKAHETSVYLNKRLTQTFLHHKNVGEIRHIGLINAIEIVQDKKTKTPFDSTLRLGYQIYKEGLKKGIILRPLGDILYFNPPLNITKEELDLAIELTQKALTEILKE